jgi:hypothetical protein
MAPMKNRLMAIIGISIGILTLRTLRKRSGESEESEIKHDDLDTASGHAAAAADHAKLAAERAVKERKKKA